MSAPPAPRGSRTPAARTPLMAQYARIKAEHPDAFLFFRLGDFYEMFFDDAVRGAALLGLTLTSRNRQDPDPIPMCGIPWHQRDAYLGRLLRLGHKVAVCDQTEDPALAKGLVQRAVTEVLTPGSVTGDAFLEGSANNFLAALWPADEALGLCLADASTGEIKLADLAWEDASPRLARLDAAEWVFPRAEELDPGLAERLATLLRGLAGARSPLPVARFAAEGTALDRLGGATPAPDEPAARAAAAALDYLDRMAGGRASQLTRVERWSEEASLRYDGATAAHLELFRPGPGGRPEHTLWHHLNLCTTGPGSRRLRGWLERPLLDSAALERRHDAVAAWLASGEVRASFRDRMRGLPDLERLAARLSAQRATPRDLGALRDVLLRLPGLRTVVAGRDTDPVPGADAIDAPPGLADLLVRALVEDPPPLATGGGIFRAGYDADRDALDDLAHSGKRWIADLEATERARTGIGSLKVGYNRVFGYYLEVTRAHLEKVPADWERRQTLTGAERFVTPELKAKEREVLSAEDRLEAREHELFGELRSTVAGYVPPLVAAAEALAGLDAEAALAEAAARYAWSRPGLDDSDALELDDLRHPVVERLLPGGGFVPNPCRLDGARRQILLLTGPNMGGKSTYLRSVAIAVLLAQTGSFVPASRARIGRVDRLFTRVGAADRQGIGQSTFLVEMSETAEILRAATGRSLVLLDEVGRGTATYDGLALAWAVTEHLHAAGGPRPRTIFATHFHELTQLAETLPRLANVHVAVREAGKEVVFLHRIAEGPADRSYGIHVARLAGVPERVLARAAEVLHELESERTVERLEPPRGTRRAPEPQLPLFAPDVHPVVAALRALHVETLTPLDALNAIAEWKRMCGEE